jgi:hypothetical protein
MRDMMIPRWMLGVAAAAALAVALPAQLSAQGSTTGAISGTVTSEQGEPLGDAQVAVTNPRTGFRAGVSTNASGRYTIPGLEVGSAYSITVRRIGYQAITRENVTVSLGQTARVDFQLTTQATQLGEVTVTADAAAIINPERQGTVTQISDSLLRRLPSLNRNFTDFVALTPQVSTTMSNGGISGGGSNNRFNNITIDGVTETDVFGLGSTGQPGGQANGKSIGLESVREYQVLLSPYDVRYGNFAGVLINAVTKSGTNEFRGSAFYVTRNDQLARNQPYLNEFEQSQYGFSLGGPILRDKAFFFISPEWQDRSDPANGPYLGTGGVTNLPQADVDRFTTLMTGYGFDRSRDVGNANFVSNRNPLTNVFSRLDFNLPYNSQLVVRYNYGEAERDVFSRSQSFFQMSQNGYAFTSKKHAPAAQLRTLFSGGQYNELLVGLTRIRDVRQSNSSKAQVQAITSGYGLTAGGERFSHLNELDQDIVEITDNFTMPLGDHKIVIGTQNQFMKFRNAFGQATRGVWVFNSLDSLQNAIPREYVVGVPIGGDGIVRFRSNMHSGYLGDEWAFSPKLNLQFGIRADMPVFPDKPPFNQGVLDNYKRNTAEFPSGNLLWSPRFGFNYDVTGEAIHQVRGGAGMFAGRPAYVWLSNGFQNSGMGGFGLLTCSNTATITRTPAFNTTNLATAPQQCATGETAALAGEINLINTDFKFPQNLRGNLAYDFRFMNNWVATFEGIYTRYVNAIFYQNLALRGVNNPTIGATGVRGTSAAEAGRWIYGTSTGSGNGTPDVIPGGRTLVLEASNQSKDYAYNLTGQLTRRYADNYEASVAYTYSRSFDVQSFSSSTAFSQYRYGRATGYDQTAHDLGRSIFEQRHRIVAYGTYSFPSKTDVSLQWFGESGAPFSYTVNGDANGDGITENDPIYVPKNALDPNEMAFAATRSYGGRSYTALEMRQAFESYINNMECLSESRGKILARNSCDNPFTNTVNVLVRQSLPQYRGHALTLELGVFNFLNLVNEDWGIQPSTGGGIVRMLDKTGQVGADLVSGKPVYAFNPTWTDYFRNNSASNYQLQLQARYSF